MTEPGRAEPTRAEPTRQSPPGQSPPGQSPTTRVLTDEDGAGRPRRRLESAMAAPGHESLPGTPTDTGMLTRTVRG